ncbi:MAG: hypothetical protein M3O15_11140 [Acidobacteriota bacterium]|nr:hypothetical protein [Acidobacteriota bacterium]
MARRVRQVHHHRFNAPTRVVWIIAVIVGLLGILLHFRLVVWPGAQPQAWNLEMIAFVLLAIATVVRGL